MATAVSAMRVTLALGCLTVLAVSATGRHLVQDSSPMPSSGSVSSPSPSPSPETSGSPARASSPATTASFASYPEALSAATARGSSAPISIFLAAVQAANLTLALDNGNPYTILAPTNDSFAAALKELGYTQDALLADKPLLIKILSYHVIPGAALLSSQLTSGQKLDTLLKDDQTQKPAQLTVSLEQGGGVKFTGASDSAMVVTPDIKAGHAVVHVIGAVLVPPGVAPAGKSSAAGTASDDAASDRK